MGRFRTLVLLIGLLLIPAVVFAQDRPDAIQELYDRYRSAALDGNADRIAELFADDGRVYHSDGTVHEGQGTIRNHRSENFEQFTYSEVRWQPIDNFYLGENAWCEIGRFTGVAETDQGDQNRISFEYTALNEKIDGEWKIKRVIVYRRGS